MSYVLRVRNADRPLWVRYEVERDVWVMVAELRAATQWEHREYALSAQTMAPAPVRYATEVEPVDAVR